MSNRNSDWDDDMELTSRKSDNKDLVRFFGRLISNWYWFVLCGLLGLLCSFIYLRYTIPIYKVTAKILVSDDKKGGGMLSASALGDLSGLMGAKTP